MQLLAASAHDGWFRLDPRTKLLLVITVNVAALTRVEQTAALVSFVCAAFLLVTIGSWRALGIQVLLFGICRGIQVLGTQILEGPVWQTVGAVGFFLGNFVTVLTMGVYLARSTTPSELIEGLRRLRTPDAIIIPLAVMLRFFPTLGEELTAVIRGLEALNRPCQVTIHTDSQYVKNGMESWIHGWKKNGWKTSAKQPVKNAELWQQLDQQVARHQVSWQWVKGHAGHPENERADQLANQGAANISNEQQ